MKKIKISILTLTTVLGKVLKEFFLIAGAIALGGALVIKTNNETTLFWWGIGFLIVSVVLSLIIQCHEKRVKIIEESLK